MVFRCLIGWGLLLLGPGEFRGCGGDGSAADRDLPPGEYERCLVDSDCAPQMCADIRCLAGGCEVVADSIDRDLDGQGPMALGCGGDCDDNDATRRAGAIELCNGVDEDCDGSVDEGAIAESPSVFPITVTPLATLASLRDEGSERFILFDQTPSLLFANAVAATGTLGPPQEMFRLARGGAFAQIEAARSGEDVLLVARTDIGAIRWAVVRAEESEGFALTVGPIDLELPTAARDVVVRARPGGWYVAIDAEGELDPSETVRLVFDDLSEPATFTGLNRSPDRGLDIAPVTGGYVQLLEGHLSFHVGDSVTEVTPPSTAYGRRPLTSLQGEAVLAFADEGFGYLSLQRFDAAGPVGPVVAGPSAADGASATLFPAGDDAVAIASPLSSGAAVWLRDSDLEALPGRESPILMDRAAAPLSAGWAAGYLGALAAAGATQVGFSLPCDG